MRLTKFVSFLLIIFIFGGVMLGAEDAALAYSDRLCRGLSIAGVSVGGLTVGEAEKKVAAALQDRQSKPIARLQYADQHWDVAWDAVAGKPDAGALVQQAYEVGRAGNLFQRLRDQFFSTHGGSVIPLGLQANNEKLKTIVIAAAAAIDRNAVDAGITESAAGVKISADQTGRKTDRMLSVQKLSQAIETGDATVVSLVVAEMPAKIRAKDLQGIDSLLSAFSTTYNAADENRSRNIQIAAEKLTGTLLRRGEVFSFNDRVGLRTEEQGYKPAPTLSSAGVVMDWGGGVCQVSTTLYNAALLADFAVIERSAHYDPPSYVPLGQDATVADGQIDLKLKNVTSHAVYFWSVADAGNLEVRIYGKREQGAPAIRIESVEKIVHVPKTIMLQDPQLPLGQEVVESAGRHGFVVTVKRIRLHGTREINRENISTDDFDGSDRIVRVGTYVAPGTVKK